MAAPVQLTIIAFADADNRLTGVALGRTMALFRDGSSTLTTYVITADPDVRVLRGLDTELRISAADDGAQAAGGGGAEERRCRVVGAAGFGDEQLTIDALGTELTVPLPGSRLGLVRFVAAWLGTRSLSLIAVRSARARGHGRDIISAWQREADQARVVAEPRLSITTLEDHTPVRLGIELWIEHEDGDTEYPWRISGEVSGPGVALRDEGLRATVHPIAWGSPEGERSGLLLVGHPG